MNEEDLKATKIQVQVLEEILSYKDKEIERLKEMKLHTEKYASEMEDKYILEKNKNNKAIEYIESNFISYEDSKCFISLGEGIEIDILEIKELLEIFKGDDKE